MKIKPSILAKALHISTDGLRKQRIRGNSPYEYEIIEGRVFYNTHTLPPSVREWCENFTSKKTRTPHKQNKSPRYWNSIGKRNEIRIRNKQKRLKEEERRAESRGPVSDTQEPRNSINKYVSWVNPHTTGNYWNSIEDYENSKKKKTFDPIY